MTAWVGNPRGGRERGVRGILRAWVEVVVHPRRFFANGVAPGDQAPGLVFGVLVALWYAVTLLATGTATIPSDLPVVGGAGALTTAVVLAVVALLIAPATLHLLAAVQTVLLLVAVRDRAGVSETVQVIAYSTAPCVLSGLPSPELRVAAAAYGAVLLALGVAEVHGTSLPRAGVVTAVPAALLFGYGFRGFAAVAALA